MIRAFSNSSLSRIVGYLSSLNIWQIYNCKTILISPQSVKGNWLRHAKAWTLELHLTKQAKFSRKGFPFLPGKKDSFKFSLLFSITISLSRVNRPNSSYFLYYHRKTKILSSSQLFSPPSLLVASNMRSGACLLLLRILRRIGPPKRSSFSSRSFQDGRKLRICNGSAFAISYLNILRASSSGPTTDVVRCGPIMSTRILSTKLGRYKKTVCCYLWFRRLGSIGRR